MKRISSGPPSSRGFSLLEVLVAFSILALSLGVLLQIFAAAPRHLMVGDSLLRAAELAESTLASVGGELPLEPGVHSGEGADMSWQLAIAPYDLADMTTPPAGLAPYSVAVEVHWEDAGRARRFALTSLRLGSAQRP